jgi:hypothetical protein
MAPRRTGLTVALVLVGALVAGGALGLVLVSAGGEPATSPLTSSPITTAPITTAPMSTSAALPILRDAASTGQAIADAITSHDADAYAALTCEPQTSAALDQLREKWDSAGTVQATMSQPPVVSGDTASVTIHVQGPGGRKDTVFPLRRQGTAWCIPG